MSKSDNDKDTSPGTDAVDAANAVENMSDDALQAMLEQSRIVIRPGGEVVIENLTADLLDVAYELDPDNPGVACDVPEGEATEVSTPTAKAGDGSEPTETAETS